MMGAHAEVPLYKRLKFVVAEGKHRESAWFNFRTSEYALQPPAATSLSLCCCLLLNALFFVCFCVPSRHCAAEQLQPVFSFSLRPSLLPSPFVSAEEDSTEQFFMHHPQAVIHLRKQLTNFMLNTIPMVTPFAEAFQTIHRYGRYSTALTKRVLIQNVPEYWISVL